MSYLSKDQIAQLKYRTALRKAKRPPYSWFKVLGVTLLAVFFAWLFLSLGAAVIVGLVAYILIDRRNRRLVENQVAEVRVRFGKLEE